MFLFIWGFRVRSSDVEHGVFFCPNCGGDRDYVLKRARRWFTFFFVPMIPLKQLGEYVQCQQCRTLFGTQVLDLPTTSAIQSLLETATREAVVGLLRVGGATTAAIDAAMRVLSRAAGRSVGHDEVSTAIEELDVTELMGRLAALAGSLNEHGRESFLASCVEVAVADGTIDANEQAAIEQIGQALLMTSAHTRGVVAQTVERLSQH